MVGVQPHQSPSSSTRNGPGRSQMPVGTATRPRSWTSPARYASAGSSDTDVGARSRHSSATPRECPWKNGDLEVGRVAESGQRLVQVDFVAEPSTGWRFGVHDGGPDIVRACEPQQLGRALEEDRRDRRVEGTAGPAGDRRGGRSRARRPRRT